jgi:hypothetical protein
MAKKKLHQEVARARAEGSVVENTCLHFLELLSSGEKHGIVEVAPPAGYDMLSPRMFLQDSDESNVKGCVLE